MYAQMPCVHLRPCSSTWTLQILPFISLKAEERSDLHVQVLPQGRPLDGGRSMHFSEIQNDQRTLGKTEFVRAPPSHW